MNKSLIPALQRIAMTLTRMHATGTPLAVAMRSYMTPKHNRQTTTSFAHDGKRCVWGMPHNLSLAEMLLTSRRCAYEYQSRSRHE
jgi:hypothetical protein